MCCHEAFPASATSASSPTADEPTCCHSAALYSTRLLPLRLLPPHSPPHYGSARAAMDSCISSNGSRPHNSSSPKQRKHTLTPPSRQIQAALIVCFTACSPEVCLRHENGALHQHRSSFPIIFLSDCVQLQRGLRTLAGLHSCLDPA